MKTIIKEQAQAVQIDLIGFAEAKDATEFLPMYQERIKNNHLADVGGVGELAKRLRVSNVMPEAKTIIAVGLSYHHPVAVRDQDVQSDKGIISVHVFRRDYHKIMQQKMQELVAKMDQITQQKYKYQTYCDTGVLDDRICAYRAGLGFFGKNNFIIHPELGSYLFLGHILTDLPIEAYDVPMENRCGECTSCIEHCESGALYGEYKLNPKRCISNLTQKKVLREEEKKRMGRHIYGCDVCQQVCPFNQRAKISSHACFEPKTQDIYVSCDEIIGLGEAGFAEKYKDTALYWRGYDVIKRNAKIVKENIYSEEKDHE